MATVTSININGLRDKNKMKKLLFTYRSDIICIQETNWEEDKVKEMREEWRGDIYYNNGAKNARGVAILFKKDIVEGIREVYKDQRGRILVVEFMYRDMDFRLINIYVPNIEGDRREILKELKGLIVGKCIIVGDFNIKCSRLDVGKGVKFRWEKSRGMLMEIMREKGLIDVWRYENPEKREFTRRQLREGILKQSRIDLVLVEEEIIRYIDGIKHQVNSLSDHDSVRFRIKVGSEEVGGGMWILNAGYIEEEEYEIQMKDLLNREEEKIDEYTRDGGLEGTIAERWEEIKDQIKLISIKYSKKRRGKMKKEEIMLRERLREELVKAEDEEGYSMEKYIEVKMALEKYEREKCRGAILRSKAKYALEGEKCTGYFLGLEKRRQSKTYINEINTKEGKTTKDYVEILERVQEFYGELYKRGEVDERSIDGVLESVENILNKEDAEWCDREIDEKEVEAAIGGLKSGKSPGSDGIGIEWYKTYREEVAPILVKVFKEMERTGMVQDRMVEGVIALVYKKGNRLNIENYRPISLLNVDYKILTKVLANRVKKVIGSIVQPTQSYSIPGRDIADTIGTVRDVIEYMKRDKKGGIVLGIDWNKAFDRVEHKYLFKVLEKFGFGSRMIGWVKRLYEKAKSCIKINGVLTDRFKIGRSVRQGCPLSALLYAISVEPLATLIKRDRRVVGIELPYGGMCTINQYADDTTITVREGNSVKRVLEIVKMFGKASGAKINVDKSELMYIGEVERVEVGIRVEEKYMKVLGVYLGVESKEARDVTWTGVINKIRTVSATWKGRKLKLNGKVIVVNSLLLSVCVYVMSVMEMPGWVMNELNKIVCDFIWEGKGVKIAQKTLVGKRWEGGLSLMDLEIKRAAMRIKTVKKYMGGLWDYGWKEFLRKYIDDVGGIGDNGWYMGFKQSMTEGIPEIYREVLEAWRQFLPKIEYECEDIQVIKNLPLFLNEKIKHKNKTLYECKFIEGGIKQVKDIMYEVIPGFLKNNCIYDTVCDLEGMENREKVNKIYGKIKSSIPLQWTNMIEREYVSNVEKCMPEMYVDDNAEKNKLKNMSVKNIYRRIIVDVIKEPASEKVWKKVFEDLDVKKIWSNLNIKYNSIECENNDFLIRHNRIYTNVVLNKINNEVNVICDVCGNGHESFLHYFLRCEELVDFFDFLKNLLLENWSVKVETEEEWGKLFLFGTFGKRKSTDICLINFVLSHARLAVVLRRNYAHFEGRKVKVKDMFKSMIQRDVELICKYGDKEGKEFFLTTNKFIHQNVGEEICFNW